MPDERRDHLTHIREVAEDRLGEALDERESVTADPPDILTDRQEEAHVFLRNEDFPGAAQVLSESASRSAGGSALSLAVRALSLAVREHTRRRG